MPNNNKRGDNVASSRSSSRVEKKNIVKKGEQHQQEFTRMIEKMFSTINAQLEVEPNVDTINNIINKKDKKKLN